MHYYIVPGFGADENSVWYPWLDQLLSDDLNAEVTRLAMPSQQALDVAAWQHLLMTTIKTDAPICLIGHSLGCWYILHYLSQNNVKQVNVILVGGFDTAVTAFSEFKPLLAVPLNYEQIQNTIDQGLLLTAKDDPVVNWQQTFALATRLHLDILIQRNGGHFLGWRQPLIGELAKLFYKDNLR